MRQPKAKPKRVETRGARPLYGEPMVLFVGHITRAQDEWLRRRGTPRSAMRAALDAAMRNGTQKGGRRRTETSRTGGYVSERGIKSRAALALGGRVRRGADRARREEERRDALLGDKFDGRVNPKRRRNRNQQRDNRADDR